MKVRTKHALFPVYNPSPTNHHVISLSTTATSHTGGYMLDSYMFIHTCTITLYCRCLLYQIYHISECDKAHKTNMLALFYFWHSVLVFILHPETVFCIFYMVSSCLSTCTNSSSIKGKIDTVHTLVSIFRPFNKLKTYCYRAIHQYRSFFVPFL